MGRRINDQAICHVLDSQGHSTEVAIALGLQLTTTVAEAGSEHPPMVIVVDEPGEIHALRARAHELKLGAIITFGLREADTIPLYDLGVPVFVGTPEPGELLGAVQDHQASSDDARLAQKQAAGRYAELEALLTTPQRI